MGRRVSGNWGVAVALAVLLNLVLLALMPGLIVRPKPDRPMFDIPPAPVEVIRTRYAETPIPESRKTPAEPKTPEKIAQPLSQPLPLPETRMLPFEFAPNLPEMDMGHMSLPVIERFDVSDMPSEYGIQDIDAPLTAVSQTPPMYPVLARRRGVRGRVMARYVVNEQGIVEDIRIVHAEPPDLFDESAIRAISAWRFVPGKIHGVPVRTKAEAEFVFRPEQEP